MDIKTNEVLQAAAPKVSVANTSAKAVDSPISSSRTNSKMASIIQKDTTSQEGDSQVFFENVDLGDEEALQEKITNLMSELNVAYNPLNLNIAFAYSEDIQALYVEVKRIDTGEVLRQVPSEEAIKFMAALREMHGAIFDMGA